MFRILACSTLGEFKLNQQTESQKCMEMRWGINDLEGGCNGISATQENFVLLLTARVCANWVSGGDPTIYVRSWLNDEENVEAQGISTKNMNRWKNHMNASSF